MDEDDIQPYTSNLVALVGERLGDANPAVQRQAVQVLLSLVRQLPAEQVSLKLEALWGNPSAAVRCGLLQVVTAAVGLQLLAVRDQDTVAVKRVIQLADDPDKSVREAACRCVCELHRHLGDVVTDAIYASTLRPSQQREVFLALDAPPIVAPAPKSAPASRKTSASSSLNNHSLGLNPSSRAGSITGSLGDAFGSQSGGGRQGSNTSVGESDTDGDVGYGTGGGAAAAKPAAAAAAGKRGGYKDGGGVSLDGELMAVAPISVASERELRSDMENLTMLLAQAPNADWQQRMSCMARVEGLLLGGASSFEAFHECMKPLTAALAAQFVERRSIIARQTCHLLCALAADLGQRFEACALAIIPTLFTVLVITVQIMADSAHECIQMLLAECQTAKLMAMMAEGVVKEKNPKSRKFCAAYLVQMVECWEPTVWQRVTDSVEAAVKAATNDILPETRTSGRQIFCAYSLALPDRAAAFLKKCDASLSSKLASAVAGSSKTGASTVRSAPRPSIKAAMAGRASNPGTGPRQRNPRPAPPPPSPLHPSSSSSSSTPTPPSPPRATPVPSSSRPGTAPLEQQPATPFADTTNAGARRLGLASATGNRKSMGLPPARVNAPGSNTNSGSSFQPAHLLLPSAAAGAPAAHGSARRSTMGFSSSLASSGFGLVGAGSSSSQHAHEAMTAAEEAAPSLDSSYSGDGRSSFPGEGEQQQQPQHGVHGSPRSSTESAAHRPLGGPGRTSMPARVSPRTSSTFAPQQQQHGSSGGGGSRVVGAAAADVTHGSGDASLPASSRQQLQSMLPRVVATLGQMQGKPWTDKVAIFRDVAAALQAPAAHAPGGAPPGLGLGAPTADADVVRELERHRERFLEGMEEAHGKAHAAAPVAPQQDVRCLVNVAALVALKQALVHSGGRGFEPLLERLQLQLFRFVDQKDSVKALAAEVLQEMGTCYRADLLLPCLSKALDVLKTVGARLEVLVFYTAFVGAGRPAGRPSNGTFVRQWVQRVTPMLDDKSADVRRKAREVMEQGYRLGGEEATRAAAHVALGPGAVSHHPSCPACAAAHVALGPGAVSHHPSCPACAAAHDRQVSPYLQQQQQQQLPLPSSAATPMTQPRQQQHQPPALTEPPSSSIPRPWTSPDHNNNAHGTAKTLQSSSSAQAPPQQQQQQHQQPAAFRPRTAAAAAQQQQQYVASNYTSPELGSRTVSRTSESSASLTAHAGVPFLTRLVATGGDDAAVTGGGGGQGAAAAAAGTSMNMQQLAATLVPRPVTASGGYVSGIGTGLSAGHAPRVTAPVPPTLAAQLTQLQLLLSRAQKAPSAAALNELGDAAMTYDRDPWSKVFPQMMAEMSSWAEHPDRAVRESSFKLLGDIICTHPHLFEHSLPATVGRLLAGQRDGTHNDTEVKKAAKAALARLARVAHPVKVLAVLASSAPPPAALVPGAPSRPAALATTRIVLEGIAEVALNSASRSQLHMLITDTPSVFSGAVEATHEDDTGLRRAGVMLLATLWFRTGHWLKPRILALDTTVAKLVALYFLNHHGFKNISAGGSGAGVQQALEHPLVLADQAPIPDDPILQ
ncbi:MAG: hypothetical protein WDW36_004952 [Sanguina aurantia]